MMKSLLDELAPDVRAAVTNRMVRRQYRHGQMIVFQGDPSANVFLIESGHVAVRVGTAEGDSVTVNLLGPGNSFGELATILGGRARTADVVALDKVEVAIIAERDFDELRSTFPQIDRLIVETLAQRVLDLGDRLTEILYESANRRCARRLLEAAVSFSVEGSDRVVVPITQMDLASLAGATRPTVNKALAQLSYEGVARPSRGSIEVLSIRALRAFID